MKTHQEHFIELLQAHDDPHGGLNDTARVKHLLLFAKMLDERETDQFRDATKKVDTNRFGTCNECGKQATIWDASFGTFCAACAPVIAEERGQEIGAQPTNEAHAFSDELVARLRLVQQKAIRESLKNEGACHPDVALRAVLSELAKAPVEDLLPSVAELARVQWKEGYGSDDYSDANATDPDPSERLCGNDEQRRMAVVGLELVRARIAPMIAAKDAQLVELRAFKSAHEAFLVQSDVTHRILDEAGVPNREMTMRNESRVLKMQDRVALLIQGKDETIAKQAKRIAELEKQHVYQMQRAAEASAKLLMCEAEEAPVIVDGKTPGRVLRAEFARIRANDYDEQESAELAALAVLRVFGGLATLQSLKARIADITEENNGFRAEPLIDKALVLLAIEDAIAKCGSPTSSQSVLDKLRERFTYTPESGDGDGGKWILRSDVLNAIDEFSTPTS